MSTVQGRNCALMGEFELNYSVKKENCVFISYKKEDAGIVSAIRNYLMHIVGADVYFDQNDYQLQETVRVSDDEKIVKSINRGLACSSDLLCIVTNATRLS